MLENKTKQDDTYLDLESPLFGDARERRRSALEVEDPREETEQRGEPFWLKVLCCVVVFPIVRANGKCQCNGANIAWSIFPLVLLSVWSVVLVNGVLRLFQGSHTLSSVALLSAFLVALLLTLSYTRNSFSKAISQEEDQLYVNTLAKRGVILSVFIGSIAGGLQGVLTHSWFLGFATVFFCACVFSMVSVVIIRCLFVTHTQGSQQNILLELAQGANVHSLQKKLLENGEQVEKASAAYLQAPLGVCFTLGTMNLGMLSLLLYVEKIYLDAGVRDAMLIVAFALVVLVPLWVLTRIDKQYMWTLRNLLSRNILMKDTEHSRLLLAYATIAPRAMLFDVYITRGRVATLAFASTGALFPKLVEYLMTLKVV
jgi:hypothetical protein